MKEMTKVLEIGDPSLDYLFGGEHKDRSPEMISAFDSMDVASAEVSDIVDAVLESETKDEWLFSANYKDYIRVPKSKEETKFIEGHKFGDLLQVEIKSVDKQFLIRGSLIAVYETLAHEELQSLDKKQHISAYIKEATPSGYNVQILRDDVSVDGFMPHTLAGINKLHPAARAALVGTTVEAMIESYAAEKGTYIISRRKYLKTLAETEIRKLNNDDVYTGHVTGTAPFGVFVEFNKCFTGLIHKDNLHPDWQNKIKSIEPGTNIDFYVKEIVQNRIILTQLDDETIWDEINEGDVVIGKIVDVLEFGVVVSLDGETNGMINNSELTGKKMTNIVVGNEVKVTITRINQMYRKISLKLA